MSWKFEKIAGPHTGSCGGLAWDGEAMLYSAVNEGCVHRFHPASGKTEVFRRYTNRVSGIALGPKGELYGCQEGGRRVIEFVRDGSSVVHAYLVDGKVHNYPNDMTVDRAGRIWFSDPYHPVPAAGVQVFPLLDHASVLRLDCDRTMAATRGTWTIQRVTFDTAAPRAVLLSPDEKTLYVAEGDVGERSVRELRAYPVRQDGSVGAYRVLHVFGADYRGTHRGIEGMCLDSDGNIVAVGGWKRSGPGPLVHVFSPTGAILETHELPGDLPVRCAFGDAGLDALYVTTAEGMVYRAQGTGRQGYQRFAT